SYPQTFAQQYTGSSWTSISSPNVNALHNDLFTVACDQTVNCWAAGDYATAPHVYQTLVEQSVQPNAPPVITSLTPAAGPVGGGQVVTVSGYGFVSGMTVTLGGASVTPSNVTSTSFTFTTPAHRGLCINAGNRQQRLQPD